MAAGAVYDAFLSHASPDKMWVRTLCDALCQGHGLRPYLDERQILLSDNFVLDLSDALRQSRFLVLVLSADSVGRPWVRQEWTSFMAMYGPAGRIIPVLLDAVELPPILRSVQALDATDRDARRAAARIAERLRQGDPPDEPGLPPKVLGQDLFFTVQQAEDDKVRVINPCRRERLVVPPWKTDRAFGVALLEFSRLVRQSLDSEAARADLHRHALCLGQGLFDLLLDEDARTMLDAAVDWPLLVTILAADDELLSLPWELLCRQEEFLVRDGRIDLVRSVPGPVPDDALPRPPAGPLRLVVNVSAPYSREASPGLHYEHESYRITRALDERSAMVPTELGTAEDLLETIVREKPLGVHFSGHGAPGQLLFEDLEGGPDAVEVAEWVRRLRTRLAESDGSHLPRFVYLACCHGNDPAACSPGFSRNPAEVPPKGGTTSSGAESSAACLHREGFSQVVGYSGPIADDLSTAAEAALYDAVAAGHTTRYAVRQARRVLSTPPVEIDERFRKVEEVGSTSGAVPFPPDGPGGPSYIELGERATAVRASLPLAHPFPMAWSQLVFYQRRPEFSLSVRTDSSGARWHEPPRREVLGMGHRRRLTTGFIGRRLELHRVRRLIREGRRVLVFQGLGGLGKSTLALHVLPILAPEHGDADTCVLWCQEAAAECNLVEGLVKQFLDDCRQRMGTEWEPVVQAVDRQAGDDSAARFLKYVYARLEHGRQLPSPAGRGAGGEGCGRRLVLYFDNLESLLTGPNEVPGVDRPDPAAFGQWRSSQLQQLWQGLLQLATDRTDLHVLASCRYRHDDFRSRGTVELVPVSPMPADALYRMTAWFEALRRLSPQCRARLVTVLDGHPRAVEFADALVADAIGHWEDEHGPWPPAVRPDAESEWQQLVARALPQVRDKLWDDLLLAQLWDRVLDPPARRLLFRMTLLREPWEAELIDALGDAVEPPPDGDRLLCEDWGADARATFERLRRCSLVQQVDLLRLVAKDKLGVLRRYMVHPATAEFVASRLASVDGIEAMRQRAHVLIARQLVRQAEISHDLAYDIDAGLHLFQAGEYNKAYELLGRAAQWLEAHGRVREGLMVLRPFLEASILAGMEPLLSGRLLHIVGFACYRSGESRDAIAYYDLAIAFARKVGDRQLEGHAIGGVGLACAALGDLRKAIEFYEQYGVIAREIDDKPGQANALGNLGSAFVDLGEADTAIRYHEKALMILREIDDRRAEGVCLGSLGLDYKRLGDVRKAIEHFEKSLAIAREIGDRQAEGNALGNLGNAYAGLGKARKAIEHYAQSLHIAREIGDRYGEGNSLGSIGLAYAALGETGTAIRYYEQVLAIFRRIGDRRNEGKTLGNLGLAYSRLNDVPKAIKHLEQQMAICRELGDHQGEAADLAMLSVTYVKLGERGKAKDLLTAALEIGRVIEDPQIIRACEGQLGELDEEEPA